MSNSSSKKIQSQSNSQLEPKIGVFVCDCGSNIAGVIDVPAVVDFASGLNNVVIAEEGKWICSIDYLTKIKETITKYNLDRVVVACCTPRTHEPTFKATLKEAGLNPFLLEFVSIREQSSWVHKDNPTLATDTAKDLVRMGVAKARYLRAGEEIRIPVGEECLVIGGGIAGITAALALGDLGFKVLLIERTDKLGGILNKLHKLAPSELSAEDYLKLRLERIRVHKNISVFTKTEVSNIRGYIGNFSVEFKTYMTDEDSNNKAEIFQHKVSTIIVATGMKEIEPFDLFGYGKIKNVITQLQLEEMLKNNDERLSKIKVVAFINCVNSRNDERGCCNIGCLSSIKNIKQVKELNPNLNSYLFFRDFNITGMDVQYHYNSMDKYTASFRYLDSRPPVVSISEKSKKSDYKKQQNKISENEIEDKITINCYDILTNGEIKINVDLLVLTPGYTGDTSTERLKGLLKVSTNSEGFFQEAHVKLRPLDFPNEGIYVCGCARSPKGVNETLEESIGAAMRAVIPMNRQYIETEGIFADIKPSYCISCGICMDTCAFGALELMNNEVEIIKAICKGCGTCVASCPVEAIDILHFSDEQILAQVDAALAEKPENKILVFTCHWCALGAVDNAGVSRFEYPANIRIIRVMCSGRVDPQFVLRAFELGVRGVLIAGCEMPTCHYMTGNYYAEKKVRLIKKLLELVGIDITRLRLEWLSAAEGARFAQIANEFNAQLDKLGPLNKDDFSSRDLKAALSCANSSRLRILASKSKEFVESGNKYHELFTNYELNRLLDEIVYDEFINEKIIYSLNLFGKKKPGGKFIKALAADLNIPTKRVFKNILSLIKAGLVELDYIKERSPSYKLTNNKSDNTIDPIQALNRINPEEGSSKEENDTDIALPLNKTEMVISTTSNQIRKFDCLIVGTDIIALSNALKLANENNKVCILSTTASFLTDPALLHNDFISYQQYYEDYRNLIEKCYGNENITIFRNSRIETEDKTGPVNHLKIRKKATFVIDEKCDNCGKCLDICPVNLLDFDTHGLTNKHAIYRPQPFTNSVKPVISKSIPYCMVSCPIEMDIRGYIGKIADSDIAGSMEIIRQTNPLPDICGKVCNHDCENTCARKFKDEALEIRKLKRFSVETMYREFSKINKPILMKKTSIKNKDPTNKVAIIGSGPAGLAAAHDLAQLGYPVTIFESEPEAGGMLKLGIPGYRLPPDALQNELDAIISLGVELKLKSRISKDLTIDDLKEQGYKAIFIAIGTQKSLDLGIEGTKYSGVINGLDFLKSINRGDYKISAQIGKNVVVIGGGNVAIDCARTAKRLGAENVNILYRRTRQEMPAADDEIDECEAEGVIIEYLTVPTRIIGAEVKSSGKSITKVKTLECQRTRLGPQDLSGRRRPIVIEGSEFTVDVDTILVAVGQQPDLKFLSEKNNFELTPKSTFKIDPFTSSTNIEGVFAGGDAVTGPATVIDAIKGGKIAAYNIDDYLNGDRSTHQSVDHLNSPGERRINELELIRLRKNVLELDKEPQRFRAEKRLLDVNQRISNFAEVELLISLEDAKEEAKRCLSCRMCIGCGVCQAACPQNAIDYSKTDEFITIETNKISEYPILSEGKFDNDYIRTLYSESLNVITPLELYYMLNPAGVYKGIIQRPSDGEIPGGIIFIHYPETEFINEEIKRSNNLEFEFLVRQIKYLKKTNPEINISLLTNSEPLDDFPGRYQYLSGTENKLNELEKEIEIIKQDEIEYNYNNETGNIEIKNFKNNKEKKEFDLAVVSTGYQKV